MPDLLGVLETSLYVDTFERACPFYEQVLGLNSIYRDGRLCAYDVGGRGVLPPDILLRASVHNMQADRLAAAITRASSRVVAGVARTPLAVKLTTRNGSPLRGGV